MCDRTFFIRNCLDLSIHNRIKSDYYVSLSDIIVVTFIALTRIKLLHIVEIAIWVLANVIFPVRYDISAKRDFLMWSKLWIS